MLKHFTIDKNRDLLVPGFECYQMDLSGPVQKAINAGEVDEDFESLPSWAKTVAAPIKAKGFIVRTLQALFQGAGGHSELNVDLQTLETPKQRVAMMFLPANTKSEAIAQFGDIAKEALPSYEILVVNGQQKYQGRKITNKNCEFVAKQIIRIGKPVLIIAAQMAQRSFSVPQITELYLAYDKGDNGATIQKMSRALTPDDKDKVGKIFSLSFDPNRDDKFDAMIIVTAQNYKMRHSASMSLRDAMREVLLTIDIFHCQQHGAVKMDVDDYLENALARKGISRVIGKIVDLSGMSTETITALANGNNDYFRAEKTTKAHTGRTKVAKEKAKSTAAPKAKKTDLTKARETIVAIVEHFDVIMLSGDGVFVTNVLKDLDNDYDREWVLDEFGVDLDLLYYLFDENIIRQDWIELLHEK